MFKCQECDKEFETQNQLNGHSASHTIIRRPSKYVGIFDTCMICGAETNRTNKGMSNKKIPRKYCSQECFRQRPTKYVGIFDTCVFCGLETKRTKIPKKYCSQKCFHQHTWETVTRPALENGTFTPLRRSRPAYRRFLIERDGYKCSGCGVSEWSGKHLPLDIDHIDGNNRNDLPENLRFLCPNCHRQTDTWGSKVRQSNSSAGEHYIDIVGAVGSIPT